MFVKILLTLVFLLLTFLPFNTAFAGVTQSGSYTYQIPINLPSSSFGPQPNLSLNYNSSAGNGILGVGWSLSGIGRIERDSRYGINFDENDHYLYNGQKLIKGEDGYYHTEKESFERIEVFRLSSSNSYWTVTQKNGTKYFYGSTRDSHIDAVGNPPAGGGKARVWALNKVEDVHGNYYTISYDEDAINGDYYPKTINYTYLTETRGKGPLHSVEFEYRSRDDRLPKYLPTLVDSDKRLEKISVKSNSKTLRSYELKYSYITVSKRSVLTSIQEFANDGKTFLPEHRFEWVGGENKWSTPTSWGSFQGTGATLDPYTRVNADIKDIDGDGKDDFIYRKENEKKFHVMLSSGLSFASPISWGDSYSDILESHDRYERRLPSHFGSKLVDMDGDGLVDFVREDKATSEIRFLKNTSKGFSEEKSFLSPNINEIINNNIQENLSVTDLNGDGKADFFNQRHSSVNPQKTFFSGFYNQGSGLSAKIGIPSPNHNHLYNLGSFIDLAKQNVLTNTYFADVTGDGLNDIIVDFRSNHYSSDLSSIYVQKNNGDSFDNAAIWGSYVNAGPYNSENFDKGVADFNADGLADFYYRVGKDIYVLISTSDGFKTASLWGTVSEDIERSDATTFRSGVLDINNDGLSDFAYVKDNKIKVLIGDGKSLGSEEVLGEFQGELHNDSPDADFFNSTFGDVDGDGWMDFVFRTKDKPTELQVMLHKGEFNLLKKIRNTMGGRTEIKYSSLPQIQNAIDQSQSGSSKASYTAPMQVVTSVDIYTGILENFNEVKYTTNYEYQNILFKPGVPKERRLLGFEMVKRINPDKSYTNTWYNQDIPFEGLVDKIEVYGNDNKLYERVVHGYKNKNIPSESDDIVFVHSSSTLTEKFNDGSNNPITTRVDYASYDQYGNRTEVISHGDMDEDSDNSRTVTKYSIDIDRYVMAPYMVETYGRTLDNKEKLASKTTTYFDSSRSPGGVVKGLPTKVIRENKSRDTVETFTYDSAGRLKTYKDPRANNREYTGHTRKIDYIDTSKIFNIGDSDLSIAYSTISTNALGHKTTVSYDVYMRPVVEIDENDLITYTVYDEFGRVQKKYLPGDTDAPSLEYVYGPTTDTQAPTGVLVYGTPDEDSESLSTEKSNSKNALKSSKDIRPQTYTYYDGMSRVIQTKSLLNSDSAWKTQDTYYDTSARAYKTSIPYNWKHDPEITHTTQDESKNHTINQYDAIGRVIQTTFPDKSSIKTLYGKDFVEITNQTGHRKKTQINGNVENIYEYIDSETFNTKIVRAIDGESVTDSKKNVRTKKIDTLGNLTELNDPDMGVWQYQEYDGNGNIRSMKDANGNTTKFSYDALNRLIEKKTLGKNIKVKNIYDQRGRGKSKGKITTTEYYIDKNTRSKFLGFDRYYYNNLGLLEKHIRSIDDDDIFTKDSREVKYTYDSLNRVKQIEYPDKEKVEYVYDAIGNVISVGGPQATSKNGKKTKKAYLYGLDIQRNMFGQITSLTYGNEVIETRNYDGKNQRVKKIAFDRNSKSLLGFEYDHDAAGNVTKITRAQNGSSQTESHTYDALSRLKTSESSSTYGKQTHNYDSIGNIISKETDKNSIAKVDYFYESSKPHAVTRLSKGTTYKYDKNGNIIEKTSNNKKAKYTFNSFNELVEVDDAITGYKGEYLYFDGQRVLKREKERVTRYYFSFYEEETYDEMQKNNTKKRRTDAISYFFAGDLRIAEKRAKKDNVFGDHTLTFLHHDHLGSLALSTFGGKSENRKRTAVTDENLKGSQIEYLPFGKKYDKNEVIPTPTVTPKSNVKNASLADINDDNIVGLKDFSILMNNWHEETNKDTENADIDESGKIGLGDLHSVLVNWNEKAEPNL